MPPPVHVPSARVSRSSSIHAGRISPFYCVYMCAPARPRAHPHIYSIRRRHGERERELCLCSTESNAAWWLCVMSCVCVCRMACRTDCMRPRRRRLVASRGCATQTAGGIDAHQRTTHTEPVGSPIQIAAGGSNVHTNTQHAALLANKSLAMWQWRWQWCTFIIIIAS